MSVANDNRAESTGHIAGDGTTEFVTVTIGAQLFGLPIHRVQDVFRIDRITSVPLAHDDIAGVLNLRGRIVTAIDMRRRLGLASGERKGSPMAVGTEFKGESFGLIIDEVGEVMRLNVTDGETNPANLDARWARVAAGVHRLDGRLLVILDIDRVLELSGDQLAA